MLVYYFEVGGGGLISKLHFYKRLEQTRTKIPDMFMSLIAGFRTAEPHLATKASSLPKRFPKQSLF